jgi:hypothetical protein
VKKIPLNLVLPRRAPSLASKQRATAPAVFIQRFVRALIQETATYHEAQTRIRKAQALAQARDTPYTRTPQTTILKEQLQKTGTPIIRPVLAPYTEQPSRGASIQRPTLATSSPKQHPPLPSLAPASPPLPETHTPKIQRYLAQPSTQSIECPGPDKPLILVQKGKPEIQQTTLTAEEIDSFLHTIATQTKIPLIPGLYKTFVGPFILTAVITEVVGTRFILQRKR